MKSLRRYALAALLVLPVSQAFAQGVVYRCPGNTFTNSVSPKVAAERGCKTIEGGAITIIHGTRSYAQAKPAVRAVAAGADEVGKPAGAGERVSAVEQRQRDSDARGILQTELHAEQEKLSSLLKDYNGGEPERLGGERNFEKYQNRVQEMKEAISRKEADISAIKRELAKLPS